MNRLAFLFLAAVATLSAQTLSKSIKVDPLRDIPSRNLKGFLARSDGVLTDGPFLTDLKGDSLPSLLWSMEEASEQGKWIVGTGPEGKVIEVTLESSENKYRTRTIADLPATHVLTVLPLRDGSILAGTSPKGGVFLIRDRKVVARVQLPVESIHAFLALPAEQGILVATGNPGRIYRLDTGKLAKAGNEALTAAEIAVQKEKGFTLLAEIRDRHVRKLLLDGSRIIAGSSPKGHVYAIPLEGGDPTILLENKDSEVNALLPGEAGEFFVALTHAAPETESRINIGSAPRGETATPPTSTTSPSPTPTPPPAAPAKAQPSPFERFAGRSSIVRLSAISSAETVASRNNIALYAMARRGDILVLGGGEQGDLVGYDLKNRVGLTFAGSDSAQLNGLAEVAGEPDTLLVMRNNPAGLSLLRFNAKGTRTAETRRLDLGAQGTLGAVRPLRIHSPTTEAIRLEGRTSRTSDEAEGWSPWFRFAWKNDGWIAEQQFGRFLKLKLTAAEPGVEIETPEVHYLPENRRPTLSDLRILPPNFEIRPPAESSPSLTTTVANLLNPDRPAESRARPNINSAQAFPRTHFQAVIWSVTDADGDNVAVDFQARREGDADWVTLASNARTNLLQFSTDGWRDGIYSTRLTLKEEAPRPTAQRLQVTVGADSFIVDHTPPTIRSCSASRSGNEVLVKVDGADSVSALAGLELRFNNGFLAEWTQPDDGVLDSRVEQFTATLRADDCVGATSVEVALEDEAGNVAAQRIALP